MKFFLIFFAVAILVCGGFWISDGPGSGMAWPTGIFALLLTGVLIYNKVWRGGWLSDNANNRP